MIDSNYIDQLNSVCEVFHIQNIKSEVRLYAIQHKEDQMSQKTTKQYSNSTKEIGSYEFDSPEGELSALSLCLQHLSKDAQKHKCFSASSHMLLAASEINKMLLDQKNELS